jgi:glycerol uptake facilitator-like aquaporin
MARCSEIEMQSHLSARVVAEPIGTFAFVFVGAGAAAVVGTGAELNGIAAIAFAHRLAIMVFAFARPRRPTTARTD